MLCDNISSSSLSTNNAHAGNAFLLFSGGHSFDSVVPADDREYVHKLSLVLVNTLDLNVEHGIRANFNPKLFLDPLGNTLLVSALRLAELPLHVSAINKLLKAAAKFIVGNPLVSLQPSGDDLRQGRVGTLHPPTGGNSVGHVQELIRLLLVKIGEQPRLDEPRMNRSDTVYMVGTDHSKHRHTNHLREALLDDAHSHQLVTIAGVLLHHLLQVTSVDFVDDLHVPREQLLDEVHGPPLQSLREDGVVRVREHLCCGCPGGTPTHMLLVHENPHQLCDSDSWVSIIQLDCNLSVQLGERPILLLETSNNILKGCRHEEVLLLQT
mmetsp:Transcript_3078/g.14491  ORF Transcript_3078/g.14491 Transcript_3078/m.14491 type:complete len:324 (+) Transcript_3078:171-1142(+)